MPQRNYYAWRDRMAALKDEGWSADDLAREAADQGGDAVTVARLLRDLFGLPVKEALGAALYTVHGLKYGQYGSSKTGEGEAEQD